MKTVTLSEQDFNNLNGEVIAGPWYEAMYKYKDTDARAYLYAKTRAIVIKDRVLTGTYDERKKSLSETGSSLEKLVLIEKQIKHCAEQRRLNSGR